MHVTANSKEVKKGSIFFALKGAKHDGHDFIEAAITAGASKVFSEHDTGINGVEVLGSGVRSKLAELASEMNGHPTYQLKMIGVTGTSGKTTTTYLIHHILESLGIPTARLGTNGAIFKNYEHETQNTTPDALSLQKWFKEVKDQGAIAVVMEVSSHALHQDRVTGIAWDAACFLNLSPEHMDYHPDLEHYFATKARLFDSHFEYSKNLGKTPYLVSNRDSQYGKKLIEENSKVTGFSAENQVRNLKSTRDGIACDVNFNGNWYPLQCPLYGRFQIENILAALSVVVGLGHDPEKACGSLISFKGVPGRMELIENTRGIQVFVDYAHKPEALARVLEAIQFEAEEKTNGRKIITVIGCGGDRDKTKRPVMGEIATRLSDFVILTSDNPRTEEPLQILKEIESGISLKNYSVIPDRTSAIKAAITKAKAQDVVLIAGKGHETYQIFGVKKIHFDDREEASKALK